MNLNSWLCKNFDAEKKGYVTIWNFLDITFRSCSFPALVIYGAVWMIGLAASIYFNLEYLKIKGIPMWFALTQPIIQGWSAMIKYAGLQILEITIGLYLLYKISQIKIAKCPLKENKGD